MSWLSWCRTLKSEPGPQRTHCSRGSLGGPLSSESSSGWALFDPGGPEPCVSSKIAQVPFPRHTHEITVVDGLLGCNTVINDDTTSTFHNANWKACLELWHGHNSLSVGVRKADRYSDGDMHNSDYSYYWAIVSMSLTSNQSKMKHLDTAKMELTLPISFTNSIKSNKQIKL